MTDLAKIEGLIFISGDEGIELATLVRLTNLNKDVVLNIIDLLITKYRNEDCSFELLNSNQIYRLATKRELAPIIKNFFEEPISNRLTQAALEVLAIIAYRQPVTRIEIDEIRGVQSSSIIQKLQLRNLIDEGGRKNEPGRPILYQTSSYFLDYFGLKNIEQLPRITNELDAKEELSGDLFLTAFNNRLTKANITEN